MEKEKTFNKSCQKMNKRGEYVPSIPLPLYEGWRKTCECGRSFWVEKDYEGHYALEHILGM